MFRILNIIIGLAALAAYGYLLLHLGTYLPALAEVHGKPYLRAGLGLALILILPIIGIACILSPSTFRNRFSPRYGMSDSPLLTDGFWVFLGYLILALAAALFMLFD